MEYEIVNNFSGELLEYDVNELIDVINKLKGEKDE